MALEIRHTHTHTHMCTQRARARERASERKSEREAARQRERERERERESERDLMLRQLNLHLASAWAPLLVRANVVQRFIKGWIHSIYTYADKRFAGDAC